MKYSAKYDDFVLRSYKRVVLCSSQRTMKIICEVSVHNRLAPHVKSRSQQSTLALGYHPPNTKDVDNLFIIHFSTTNKTGTRYKIKRNIEKVFTKFVDDGKTTMSFKQPPHDLMIRCDPSQLKYFLKAFKLAMVGKADAIGLSSLAVTPVPQKMIPVRKLKILAPSDYPPNGLPMSLVELNVSAVSASLSLSLSTQIPFHPCISSIDKRHPEI